jgi:DNA anti-recombination protein RmuC
MASPFIFSSPLTPATTIVPPAAAQLKQAIGNGQDVKKKLSVTAEHLKSLEQRAQERFEKKSEELEQQLERLKKDMEQRLEETFQESMKSIKEELRLSNKQVKIANKRLKIARKRLAAVLLEISSDFEE